MERVTLNIDTYKVVSQLEERGFTKEQAEGFMLALRDIELTGVASKNDIYGIKELITKEISDVRNEMLKFHILHSITIIGVMIALFQFFMN